MIPRTESKVSNQVIRLEKVYVEHKINSQLLTLYSNPSESDENFLFFVLWPIHFLIIYSTLISIIAFILIFCYFIVPLNNKNYRLQNQVNPIHLSNYCAIIDLSVP